MSKPSIGSAVIPELAQKRKKDIKKLTVLNEGSEESIYTLIFSGAEKRSANEG